VWSVCLSIGYDRKCAKTAEPIEMLFEELTRVDPMSHVLDRGTYKFHLANTIEQSETTGMRAVARYYFGNNSMCMLRACLSYQFYRVFLSTFTRWFLARDVIYKSRAYATMSVSVCMSVRLSVCDGSALAHYS